MCVMCDVRRFQAISSTCSPAKPVAGHPRRSAGDTQKFSIPPYEAVEFKQHFVLDISASGLQPCQTRVWLNKYHRSPGMMAAVHHLLCILVIFKLGLVRSTFADCQESEFEDDRGNCVLCKQCRPGQELSTDCGSGRESQCVPCGPGRYKEDRGHHPCLRCLPCAIINRVLKANCTPTANSVCGDCMPGFYSKIRIGGLQELECFPCTSYTLRTETQCYPRPGNNQPTSTAPPPQDPVILVAVIMVAMALILVALVTFSIICCGPFFKSQCQRAFQRSQDFVHQPGQLAQQWESTHSPCEEQPIPPCCFGTSDISGQVPGPVEEVHVISESVSTSPRATSSALCSLPPSVELCAIPPPPAKPHYTRSVSETQPLIRNSGCSDCFTGCGSSAEPSQGATEPLCTQTHSCASERQHWSHAPVECTELDLQNFSSEDGFSHAGCKAQSGSHVPPRPQSCSCITQSGSDRKNQENLRSSTCRNLSSQSQTCEHHVLDLSIATLGLPISEIPDSLVMLLSLKLDNTTPGQKDFRDVGVALGVQPQLIDCMQGFKALHAHLSSSISCTLLHLVQTLQRLECADALILICTHFSQ
ncbi:tumor necrosis factor receptor superfamily member 27 isoform X2 [Pseudophryne corroboree]|uniref:tumor necrosis factor receptor superfamily member 27 isoform X2 n=1 Tax=Pseudophryne corroboree TaxID=495146 RepID=UPI003081BFA1